MVGSSKILTVSYGTFSCTLEGFDDSFDTMKAIAEYFRDLAADDRYFGAEPPTPDAEMLARIAEREISRRVQAHEERGRIVLRAEAGQALSDLVTRGAAAKAQGAAQEQDTAGPVAPQDEVAPVPVPDTEAAEISDLAPEEDIRVEESAAPAEPVAAEAEAEAEVEAEAEAEAENENEVSADMDAGAEASEDGLQSPEPAVASENESAAPPDADIAAPEMAEDAQDAPSDESVTAPVSEDIVEDAPVVAVATDSFAEKLDRIRSVVSGAEGGFDSDYEDEDYAQDFLDPASDAPLDFVAAQTGTVDETAVEPDEPVSEAEPRADDIAAQADDDFEDTLAALLADAAPAAEAAEASGQEDAPEATPVEAADAQVLKVKRAELDAAVAQGLLEEDRAAPETPEETGADDADAVLSPEEEADLQRELAEVEAELQGGEISETPEVGEIAEAESPAAPEMPEAEELAEADSPAAPEVPEAAEAPGDETEPGTEQEPEQVSDRAARTFDDMAGSGDLTRMFEETDSQFDAPASSQRRSAIQHLRAAVAATRAEHKAGSSLGKTVDAEPYRSDLEQVVRPRRPQVGADATRSARPEETRPAPLKLVAEQRIDMPRTPIRPRRVTSGVAEPELTGQGPDGGFGDFVAEMGAHSLPDLLEAAAAYMADVEGRPQFSRPMLMSKLKEVEQERFSREDGLRSFGQLLRNGKLQKLAGGRFAVTEDTEFRAPGRREAG